MLLYVVLSLLSAMHLCTLDSNQLAMHYFHRTKIIVELPYTAFAVKRPTL